MTVCLSEVLGIKSLHTTVYGYSDQHWSTFLGGVFHDPDTSPPLHHHAEFLVYSLTGPQAKVMKMSSSSSSSLFSSEFEHISPLCRDHLYFKSLTRKL